MANFYTDNPDIRFLLKHINLHELAEVIEEGFRFASEFDYAPADPEEAVQNYEMVLDTVGRGTAKACCSQSVGIAQWRARRR